MATILLAEIAVSANRQMGIVAAMTAKFALV